MNRPPQALPRETMDRVRSRDPEALNAFFEGYFDRAYALIHRLVQNRAEAEDLTQQAFLKIHRAVHTLDPDRDPTSWVFAVVANTVRDYWRSRTFKQTRLHRTAERETLPDPGTAEDDQQARDTARVLDEALAGLSEKLRTIVLLRDFENLSYAEVAGILGIAETAARKRHSRALSELKGALERANGSGWEKQRKA